LFLKSKKQHMKKILFLLMAVMTISAAQAQKPYTTTAKNASISAADTITMLAVEGGVCMFEYNYTETSGTTAGKIYLEGRFLYTWIKLDSVSLSDVTTIQTLRKTVTQTDYKDYRFVNTNTSAATGTVLAGYVRRPGSRMPEPAPLPVAKSRYIPESYPMSGEVSAWLNMTNDITAAKPDK
jgi:hypothetical protein